MVSAYAGERDEWDAFVHRAPGGTFFHQIGWKEVLERSFGYTAHYLVARRGGEIAGVLPLCELRAPFMDRCLLSLPFAIEGGVCGDDEARDALDVAAMALAGRLGVRSIELRDGRDGPGFHLRAGRYFRFRRPLYATDAENLAAIPAKRRHMIRVGQRHGLTARIDPDALAVFHDLYARTARHFGTPVLPRRFFAALREQFPDHSSLMIVEHQRTPVAALFVLFFGEHVSPYYIGSRREYFRYAITDFLYWEAMRSAAARGARVFDFGRSKAGTGAYEFKRLWGCTVEPLRYRVHVRDGSPPPDRTADDPRLRWLQYTWRHLPLPLTKLLGPPIVSRYGAFFT